MLAGYRLATISILRRGTILMCLTWKQQECLKLKSFHTKCTMQTGCAHFRLVEQRWGLAPEEIVMVGDSPHDDIAGAKKAA